MAFRGREEIRAALHHQRVIYHCRFLSGTRCFVQCCSSSRSLQTIGHARALVQSDRDGKTKGGDLRRVLRKDHSELMTRQSACSTRKQNASSPLMERSARRKSTGDIRRGVENYAAVALFTGFNIKLRNRLCACVSAGFAERKCVRCICASCFVVSFIFLLLRVNVILVSPKRSIFHAAADLIRNQVSIACTQLILRCVPSYYFIPRSNLLSTPDLSYVSVDLIYSDFDVPIA